MNCPHCRSTHTKSYGYTDAGTPRQHCNNCGKTWAIAPKVHPLPGSNRPCPKCGGQSNKKGDRRLRCKSCGATFSENL